MSQSTACAECGAPLEGMAREAFCPRCLLALATTTSMEEEVEAGNAPTVKRPFPTAAPQGYELLELIGEGGMGVVFKARQRTLNRIVALKMIRSGAFANESELRRFRSEAQAAAKLQHTHVVAIHEIGEQDGRPYFSMDYIEGQNLARILRQTPLPPERAARYVQILSATVHYAHQRGILHRDLKPANILVDREDQPRITDFGLAKQLEADSDFTVSGAVLGTPSYMPPEQAAGRRQQIGPASDVYALGAILYELLTGRPPFRADTLLDTLRQVLDEEPAAPRLLNRKVPRDLETVCLKCLAKEPHRRFGSAQALAGELERFLNHEPVHSRPIGSLGRLWRWWRRNPAQGSLAAMLGLMFLLLGVAAELFRRDVLGLTGFAAEKTARMVATDLKGLRSVVAEVSQDPALLRFVEAGNTNALQQFLRTQHDRIRNGSVQPEGIRWMGGAPFESWSVFDAQGILLARWPELTSPNPPNYFGDRSHFLRAVENAKLPTAPQPQVSLAYWSRTDDRQDKFGISIGIKGSGLDQGGLKAVLMGTVATSSTRTLGDAPRNAFVVLIGGTDALTDPVEKQQPYVVMSHPSYRRGDEAFRIDKLPFDPEQQGGGWYFDPVRRKNPSFSGPWLAGWARVEGSHFWIIVQRRDHIGYAFITATLVSLLAAGLVLAWKGVLRLREPRNQPSWERG